MIRGLYTAASGMIVQQKRQENVSNNIANIETPSFKKQTLLVSAREASEIYKESGGKKIPIGNMQLGQRVVGVETDFSQGLLRETGRPEDLAIDGEGYFKTRLVSGETAYTRNGSLNIDSEGFMLNSDGFPICGSKTEGGQLEPIQIETGSFSIDSEGNIVDSEGKRLWKISLVDISDTLLLKESANGVYTLQGGGEDNEIETQNARIVSGMQEASNVNALDEMVKMMEISRSFESNQRIIQSIDETLDKAVNEIGKL